ncbi:lysis protein [Yersinia ruckeri]|uniref:lysis protein n=1 Tax=Yersinia ruckeri TaxID=29486 RepID=UPI002237A392|nr:lysis protein [Yersinia ruckeri]MCW6601743.1 lysis protein [Yersinia ruckeri]MCW6606872.1 lysis protein [Yersinia ruckeri]MCW6615803.1 lysis protein [Yersinia ruckeri]UZX95876.1 lysis protein [Yersinia ruckeri]
MNRVTAILIAVLVASLFGLTYYHYRVQSLNRDVAELSKVAKQQQATLDQIETQRQTVAAIDIKHTKELADAKSENERLRADLATGAKRLHIAASCPKLPKATATSSSVNDASPRYDAEFERNYLSLRERIGIATSQISGLQDYINNVCIK